MSRWWVVGGFVAGYGVGVLVVRHAFKKLLADGVIQPGPNASAEILNQAATPN